MAANESDLERKRTAFAATIRWGMANMEKDSLLPPVGPNYPEIAASLLVQKENGVSVFNGGPMHYETYNLDDSWLTPVEVKDKQGYGNFHVLYLNCTPKDPKDAKVEFSQARTVGLKVGDVRDAQVRALHRTIMGGDPTPRIIVRPSFVGSLYFPNMAHRLVIPSVDTLRTRLGKLVQTLKLPLDAAAVEIDEEQLHESEFRTFCDYPTISMGKPEEIYSEAGHLYMYPVVVPKDPWQFYQIFTSNPLEEMDRAKPTLIRTDSGCDIGQLYRDMGCECRDQFIGALKAIHGTDGDTGGMVIHVPTQDGRGYGMNTKMETEGIKKGVSMIYNRHNHEELDTVAAAKLVFGEKYWDVRTFHGTGRILKELGFHRINILTDNIPKVTHLRESGLLTDRIETGTKGNEVSRRHVDAKHKTDLYFHDNEGDESKDPNHEPGED